MVMVSGRTIGLTGLDLLASFCNSGCRSYNWIFGPEGPPKLTTLVQEPDIAYRPNLFQKPIDDGMPKIRKVYANEEQIIISFEKTNTDIHDISDHINVSLDVGRFGIYVVKDVGDTIEVQYRKDDVLTLVDPSVGEAGAYKSAKWLIIKYVNPPVEKMYKRVPISNLLRGETVRDFK